ncbi:hypothetical protein FFE93_016190 [Yersinia sp. KBS0713]|uniref:hypothetical protein n=1 Tax=Yersinia sp. KBS0713 TaxID=1179669 RepID=UPI00110E741E|nr:hypothetical protein [Yersinia sp. KBS0713]QDW34456.1 hypothetical protein FFE93_016190 [Yersinia sp. KBS0713]
MMVEKLKRDGNVAVLYSPGFGAGWSTWNENNDEALIFSVELVKAVLGEIDKTPIQVANELFPEAYDGGVEQLKVEWIPEGLMFEIEEYDGSESINYKDRGGWVIA